MHDRDWIITEENGLCIHTIQFECPVVYFGDSAYLAIETREPCTIWLNGRKVLSSQAGKFQVLLDPYMEPGQNRLELECDKRPDLELWLIPNTHFFVFEDGSPSISCTTRALREEGTILASAVVKNCTVGDVVHYNLYGPDGTLTDQMDSSAISQSPAPLLTGKPHFWQGTSDPQLYTVCAQLMQAGKIRDEISVRTGLRTYCVKPETGFFLNEQPFPLLGKEIHGQTSREELTELLQEGINCLWMRTPQNDPHFHGWCDELGFIVIEEAGDELERQIQKAANHPCVCFWSVPCDISLRSLQHIRAMDPTRLVVMEIEDPCQSDIFSDLCIVSHHDIGLFQERLEGKPLGWKSQGKEAPEGLWLVLK